jgi:hypothetical protein
MLPDSFPDPDPADDSGEPDDGPPPEDGPHQGLFLSVPAGHFGPDRFAQSGPAADMPPDPLLATIIGCPDLAHPAGRTCTTTPAHYPA